MAETVNEPELFVESDFADDQTTESSSPAVEETKEQPTSPEEAVESADDSTKEKANESQPGDEIESFLAKKGIKLDDPDALRKVADMYRNVEKEYGRKSQEKAQLERQIEQLNAPQPVPNSNNPMDRIQNIERQLAADRQLQAVKDWKASRNLSPEVEARMIDFFNEPIISNGVAQMDPQGRPLTKYFLVQTGALSYDDVFRAVGGDSFKADAVKEELKAAVVNEIAAKQAAKGSNSQATNGAQFSKPKDADDDFVAGLFD